MTSETSSLSDTLTETSVSCDLVCHVRFLCAQTAGIVSSMRTLSGHLQGLSLLLASMAVSCNAESAQPTYMQDGPCGALPVAHYIVPLNHSEALTGSRVAGKKLRVTVTAPAHVASLESGIIREPPWPVIFFLNGFLVCECSF